MNNISRVKVAVILIALASCSNAPVEPPAVEEARHSLAVSGPMLMGYTHLPQNSKFRIGDFKAEQSESGLRKLIGSEGVFAVDERNGSALGVPNADAPVLRKKPLTLSAELHNERVVAYFKAAGLPAEQVSGVHATASMVRAAEPVGEATESVSGRRGELEGFQSVLERTIDGVPISDSFAWARFTEDDEVAWENVHWPPIPREAIEAAHAMQLALDNRGMRDRLAGVIGIEDSSALRVTIRHSSFSVEGPVATLVGIDAVIEGAKGKARVAHFDLEGRELSLPPDNSMRIPDKR
jgi:hypothetical protein